MHVPKPCHFPLTRPGNEGTPTVQHSRVCALGVFLVDLCSVYSYSSCGLSLGSLTEIGEGECVCMCVCVCGGGGGGGGGGGAGSRLTDHTNLRPVCIPNVHSAVYDQSIHTEPHTGSWDWEQD